MGSFFIRYFYYYLGLNFYKTNNEIGALVKTKIKSRSKKVAIDFFMFFLENLKTLLVFSLILL